VDVDTASDVLANWDEIKRGEEGREPGVFGDVPANLPGPLYARKLQRRAASAGRHEAAEDPGDALARLDAADREARTEALGDALFALVDLARRERIDPELALRAAADRFRARIEANPETTRSP
jgi:XTP/dITP diphosphohydrolase/tetrapyrrole methylase family protein/MazG family protein/ATP diphosphatase